MINKDGDWRYQSKKFRVPKEENTGTIDIFNIEFNFIPGSSKVLGLVDHLAYGANVTEKSQPNYLTNATVKWALTGVTSETFDDSEDQMWTRSKKTSNGYFTLKNIKSGLYLSRGSKPSYLYIQGNNCVVQAVN